MELWKKWALSSVLFSLVVLLAAVGVFFYGINYICKNDAYAELLSPNHKYKAVVFQRDCGATTGFSTHISIIRASKTLGNESGNVYIIKGPPEDAAPEISWTDNTEFVIYRGQTANEYKVVSKLNEPKGISVIYIDNGD